MRRMTLAAGALLVAALAQGADEAAREVDLTPCAFPDPPAIPEGASATEAEMAQAGSDVRQFIADIKSSQECLAEVETSLGENITAEQQAQIVAVYNEGVDQMNAAAEEYNAQVKAFKGE